MPRLRCDGCRWWDNAHPRLEGAPEDTGLCRKHYPVVYANNNRYWASWPLTDRADFCGEHKEGTNGLPV